jgi:hypothetical protein
VKKPTLFAALVVSTSVTAQVLENPDFDAPGCLPDNSGWTAPCWYEGTGHNSCYAMGFSEFADWSTCGAYTAITGLQAEVPYELTFWTRKNSIAIDGTMCLVGEPPGITPGSTNKPAYFHCRPLSHPDTTWLQLDIEFTLLPEIAALDLFVVLSPDNVLAPGGHIFFDDFAIDNLSTGIGSRVATELRYWPDPSTDKLWVDLPDAPLSITATDATGRTRALLNFQHTSRTLELDVSALPSGLNVLRIMTRSGSHTIRFIKI